MQTQDHYPFAINNNRVQVTNAGGVRRRLSAKNIIALTTLFSLASNYVEC